MKNFEISVSTANSRYLQTAALKIGKCHDSLCSWRLKGKGKGVLGAGKRAGRARGGREGNSSQETIVFVIPPTNYVCKNNATVND